MKISIVDLHRFLGNDSTIKFSEDKRIAFCYIKNNIAYDLYDNSEYVVLLNGKYNYDAISKLNNNEEVVRNIRKVSIDRFTKEELNSMRFSYVFAKIKSIFK